MAALHFEDALTFLIDEVTKIPAAGVGQARAREQRAHGSDIWIDDVSVKYWQAANSRHTAGYAGNSACHARRFD